MKSVQVCEKWCNTSEDVIAQFDFSTVCAVILVFTEKCNAITAKLHFSTHYSQHWLKHTTKHFQKYPPKINFYGLTFLETSVFAILARIRRQHQRRSDVWLRARSLPVSLILVKTVWSSPRGHSWAGPRIINNHLILIVAKKMWIDLFVTVCRPVNSN